MKTVNISGYECIFDDDADHYCLYVRTHEDDYKSLVYTSGEDAGKRYARVLLGAPSNLQVDHINGNSLDNRRINLRLVTAQQNKFNSVVKRDKKHKLPKGITRRKTGMYQARIMHNRIDYYLGNFVTIEKAEAAYKAKAAELFGSYAAHLSRSPNE